MLTSLPHSDICKIIVAIIFPPLGVFLERGCGCDLLINIVSPAPFSMPTDWRFTDTETSALDLLGVHSWDYSCPVCIFTPSGCSACTSTRLSALTLE